MGARHSRLVVAIMAGGVLAATLVSACQATPSANPTSSTAAPTTLPTAQPSSATPSVAPTTTAPPARPPTTPRPAAPVRTAECATGNLRLGLHWDGVAAGSTYQDLVFTNVGSASCWIVGFPGVSFVTGDNGQQVGAPAVRSGPLGGRVTLAPGGSAYATVQQGKSDNYDPAICQPTEVRGFRVHPPDNSKALYVPYATTACAATELPSVQLLVHTVTARPATR